MSRSAYREAVQVLSAKGLVESRPKTGTASCRAIAGTCSTRCAGLGLFGRAGHPFRAQPVRAAVDRRARRRAAGRERRDKADLKEMRDALAAMRRHTLATDAGARRPGFPQCGLAATRNDALVVLTASIGAAVAWTTQFKQRSRALPRNPVPDHVKVYDAIAAGDVEAAGEAMRLLVDLALEDTRSAMEG